MMTEKQAFIAMLRRAGIGHGLRHDWTPPGESVLVEVEENNGVTTHGFWVSEWNFDAAGILVSTCVYEGEIG